jgi:3-deoxy-D-arabino-heptulosonate 7-phosphate (DAHP) synthase
MEDPSLATGHRSLVPSTSHAAVAVGADGPELEGRMGTEAGREPKQAGMPAVPGPK